MSTQYYLKISLYLEWSGLYGRVCRDLSSLFSSDKLISGSLTTPIRTNDRKDSISGGFMDLPPTKVLRSTNDYVGVGLKSLQQTGSIDLVRRTVLKVGWGWAGVGKYV